MLRIKKRVSLDFLGEDYKESFIDIYSIAMKDVKSFEVEVDRLRQEEEAGKSLDFIIKKVTDNFDGGSISQDGKMVEITKENLEELPSEVFIEAWTQMAGKVPKANE